MRIIPPAVDQGVINNCKAYAIAYGLQSEYGMPFDVNWLMGILTPTETRIDHMLAAVQREGAAPISEYSILPCEKREASLWVDLYRSRLAKTAAKYKIAEYKRIATADELKTAILNGWYVVFSVGVVSRYPVDADGVFRPYNTYEWKQPHAMSAWRINEDGTIRVLNSWGTKWGDNGQANMLVEDILRGKEPDCWAFRLEGEEMRKKFESAVPVGIRVFIFTEPSTKSEHVKHNGNECYLRAVDDGVILSERGDWCEITVAQSADLTVTGWVKKKYVKEKGD